jgi:hypothetical protein
MLNRGTQRCKSSSGIVSAGVPHVKAAAAAGSGLTHSPAATCPPVRLVDIIPAHFPCLSSVAVRHEMQHVMMDAVISSLHRRIIASLYEGPTHYE